MKQSFFRKRAMSSFPVLLSVTIAASACGYFSAANSQPGMNGNGTGPTVTTPAPKSSEKAERDLQQQLPLNPLKMGDPMPMNLFVELSKLINPTIVSITTSAGPRGGAGRYRDPLQEFLEDFWGGRGGRGGMQPPRPQQQPMQALGTGFIVREDGLIITNNHVIAQADVIKVQVGTDEKFYEAAVVGRDDRTDIALIKIDAKKPLPYARMGNSKDVQVGEWVAAFGNPYGHTHTMTKGIVSAVGREIAELNRFPFIQTDASINPGNSGGPLVNSQGYVIGVNTAIDARAQGIGFAIPIDNVKQIVSVLEKEGRIRRGFIGVGIAGVDEELAATLGMKEPKGVLITQVLKGGPADKAGLRPYDIVIEFNGKKTDSPSELQNAVAETDIGGSAKVRWWRYDDNGKRSEKSGTVKVSENPEDGRAARKEKKQYFGQKAPFDLGFNIADWSEDLAREFGLPTDGPQNPIVTEVQRGSQAAAVGLQPGDVILDVNRQPVAKAADVLKGLKKGRNIIRLVRGNLVIIVTM